MVNAISVLQVFPESAKFASRTVPLKLGDAVAVGRASQQALPDMQEAANNTRFAISLLSKKHGLLSRSEEGLFYEDTDSKHGSSISGKPCEPNKKYLLREGDELQLCSCSSIPLRLKISDADLSEESEDERDDSVFPSDDKYIGKNEEEAEKEAIQQELRQMINKLEDAEKEEEEGEHEEDDEDQEVEEDDEVDEVDDEEFEGEDEVEAMKNGLYYDLQTSLDDLREQYDFPISDVVLYADDVDSENESEEDDDYKPGDGNYYWLDDITLDSIRDVADFSDEDEEDDEEEEEGHVPVKVTEIEYDGDNEIARQAYVIDRVDGRKRKRYLIEDPDEDDDKALEPPAQRPRVDGPSLAKRILTFAAGAAVGGAGVFAGLLYLASESV